MFQCVVSCFLRVFCLSWLILLYIGLEVWGGNLLDKAWGIGSTLHDTAVDSGQQET